MSDANAIVVTFNKAMVPLQTQPLQADTNLIRIRPSVQGSVHWLGSRTLSFVPSDTLQWATTFHVRLSNHLTALDGTRMDSTLSWTFETPRPRLIASSLRDRNQGISTTQSFYLRFNQPMAPEKARSHLLLRPTGMAEDHPVNIQHPTARELESLWSMADILIVLKVSPTKPLRAGTEYSFILKSGLRGKEGDLGMKTKEVLSFRTIGSFHYTGIHSKTARIDPERGVQLTFSNPVSSADLVASIRFEPNVSIPDYYHQRHWGQTKHYLHFTFQPDTRYRLTIDSTLTDVYGKSLASSIVDSFQTRSYSPSLKMTTGPGVVESYGDRRYPLTTINKDSARLRMALLSPDQLISLSHGDPSLWSSSRQLADSLFLVDRMLSLLGRRNKKVVHPIELDWALAGKSSALVLLELKEDSSRRSVRRALLQVTALGVSAKFSPDRNLVWVTALDTADPIAGARVEIRGKENRILWEGRTDSLGVAMTPGWRALGLTRNKPWQRPRQWVFVYHNDQMAYTTSDWGAGIHPYRFGIDYDWNPEPVKTAGSLFTDRGIYRPGDTVHLKGLFRIKTIDTWQLPSQDSVRISIRNSRGDNILRRRLSVNDYGAFDLDLSLDEEAALGYYWVSAETLQVKEDTTSARVFLQSHFQVEAFRPAEFETGVHLDQPDYSIGDTVRADITARYLFGAPLSHQPVQVRFQLERGQFFPSTFSDYTFGRLDWGEDRNQRFQSAMLRQERGTLDSIGVYSVAVPIKAQNSDTPMQLTVAADVEGPTRQHIGSSVTVPVHPAAFYIGLSSSGFLVKRKETMTTKVISVDGRGTLRPGTSVRLYLFRREWHSVRKAGVGGRYEWLSKQVDIPVDSAIVTTQMSPVSVPFSPKQSGLHILRACATDSINRKTTTEHYFYVSGSDYVAWSRDDDDRIELIPDQSQYVPGDTASILIKSPFETAQALITLERETLFEQTVQKVSGSTPRIEIPLDSEDLPNIYISVLLVQGRSDSSRLEKHMDLGKPSFKIGYVNLPVDAGRKHLDVSVDLDQTRYEPGEWVDATLNVQDYKGVGVAAEVTLAAVDEGVLQLIQYMPPDPFDDFYHQRPLSVQTSETRIHVVEQRHYGEKGEDRGGSGTTAPVAGMDLRQEFKATAYWNPSVILDESGTARIRFRAPDNLTRFKVMAVAHTMDNCFGRGEESFEVRKPLLMKPLLPRFVRYGDRFEAGVVIHNHTHRTGDADVRVTTQGLGVVNGRQKQISLKDGESREVRFTFVADSTVKEIDFIFSARLDSFSDAVKMTVPLKSAFRSESVAMYRKTGSSTVEQVVIPKENVASQSELLVSLASTALTQLSGSLTYLNHYPYHCLEQNVSRLLPPLVAPELVSSFSFDFPVDREHVQKNLNDLWAFQVNDGGLAMWKGADRSWPYSSVYAAWAVTLARQEGYDIPDRTHARLCRYLRGILTKQLDRDPYPYSEPSWDVTEAFALYVLALNEQYDPGYAERLFERRHRLPLLAKAFLSEAMALNQSNDPRLERLLQSLVNRLRVAPQTAYFEPVFEHNMPWIFESRIRTTALLFTTLMVAGREPAASEQIVEWLLSQRNAAGHWANTQDNVYVLRALNQYFTQNEPARPDFRARVVLEDHVLLNTEFKEKSIKPRQKTLGLTDLPSGSQEVQIHKEGQGVLYYGLRLTTVPRDQQPPRDEGITVLKTMTPVHSASDGYKIGELIQVELQVVVPQYRHYVVVEDPLPAGFEPVNVSFETTGFASRQIIENETRWSGFQHSEMRDDGVVLYASSLAPGLHRFRYLVRPIIPGSFRMPSTHAEEMYHPEVFGRTRADVIDVE
jgi:hypothetical protein